MFSYRHSFHAGSHADVLKHLVLVACLRYLTQAKATPLTLIDTHAGAGLYRLDRDEARTSGEAAQGILPLWQRWQSTTSTTGPAQTGRRMADAAGSTCTAGAADVGPGGADGAGADGADAGGTHGANRANRADSANGAASAAGVTGAAGVARGAPWPAALADYLGLLADFNPGGAGRLRHYPGSPFICTHLMRDCDSLHLFELHPTDSRLLAHNLSARGRPHTDLVRNNGFAGLKALLPPPSRRGLILIDPSYELKTDYAQTAACVQDALARFATGCYLVWYPLIARTEAHQLPRRLKTLAHQAGRPWLHATLSLGRPAASTATPPSANQRPGLRASGVFVINPPFTLHDQLRSSLPRVLQALQQPSPDANARPLPGAGWQVQGSGDEGGK